MLMFFLMLLFDFCGASHLKGIWKNWPKMHSTCQKGELKDSLLQNVMNNMIFYLPHPSGCHGNRKQIKDLQKDIFPIDHQTLMKF